MVMSTYLVQHPLHVHRRLGHPQQRHWRLFEKWEKPTTDQPTLAGASASFFLDLKTSPFLPPVSLRLSSPPAPRENFLLLHCHHLSDALNLVELDAEKNTTWLLLLEETLLHCWDNTPPPPWNNSLVFKRQVFFPKLIIHIVVSLLRCCFPQNCGNRFSERMK